MTREQGQGWSSTRGNPVLSVVRKQLFLKCAPVAQLDRASGYEPEGRQFESVRAHHQINNLALSPFFFAYP